MKTASLSHIETEITLVVCDDHPERICESIETLPSVAGLRAGNAQVHNMRDVYYDTPGRQLRSAGWGLRIRDIGPGYRLTLKDRTKVTDRGAVERIELEGEWSLAILTAVVDQLAELCPMSQVERVFDQASAAATMTHIGFEVIQNRTTLRKVRALTLEPAREAGPDAELVIDRVIYSFQGYELIHHEIEIEAVSPLGAELIPPVQDNLASRFGPSLRLWLHSKLATGWALEKLLAEGHLEKFVRNGLLAPAAYDVIEERLALESVPHP
ncbi:MAG: CYTH domain-containing protein [Desulfomonile sp.]|nr:CYTH domain-containing protein [Desulfomonile sp.]